MGDIPGESNSCMRLDARPEPGRPTGSTGQPLEGYEAALRLPPDRTPLDALLLYDETERRSFAATRWPDARAPAEPGTGLAPPLDLAALYEAGSVAVRWEVDPETLRAAADGLPAGQRVAQRVYRTDPGEAPRLAATLDLDEDRWRDDDMPLLGGELAYSVWTVLLQAPAAAGEPDALVRSESSELVTVSVPEHFRLVLVSGDGTQAAFRLEVGPPSRPVAVHELELRPGDPVEAGPLSTGLVLQTLDVAETERLTTRTQLVLTSDASLVLDPVTRQPRTTESQVLMPVKRLVATLSGPGATTRTLELDLP